MKRTKRAIRTWLPLAVVVTGLTLLAYALAQQNLRLTANDPQVQIARDLSRALQEGLSPASLAPEGAIDPTDSLSVATVVYDERQAILASSLQLEGAVTKPPQGSFDEARRHGEVRITWAPRPELRLATVLRHTEGNHGFVLVGRSLHEVEQRYEQIAIIAFAAWAATLMASFVACWLVASPTTKR